MKLLNYNFLVKIIICISFLGGAKTSNAQTSIWNYDFEASGETYGVTESTTTGTTSLTATAAPFSNSRHASIVGPGGPTKIYDGSIISSATVSFTSGKYYKIIAVARSGSNCGASPCAGTLSFYKNSTATNAAMKASTGDDIIHAPGSTNIVYSSYVRILAIFQASATESKYIGFQMYHNGGSSSAALYIDKLEVIESDAAFSAETLFWAGTGTVLTGGMSSSTFDTPGNWSTSGPTGAATLTMGPTQSDNIVFTTNAALSISLSANTTIGSLTINHSGSSDFDIYANGKTLTVNGATEAHVTSGGGAIKMRNSGTGGKFIYNSDVTLSSTGGMWFLCDGGGSAGEVIFRGNVTQNSGGAVCGSNPATVTFDGPGPQTFTCNGSSAFKCGATTTNFGGDNNVDIIFTGSGTSPQVIGNLNIKANSTVDLGTKTLNRATSGGTFDLAANATLKLGATTGGRTGSNFPNDFTTNTLNATSTVIYNSADGVSQTIYDVTGSGYGNLTLANSTGSGSCTKTAGGGLDIQGDFTIEDAFTIFDAGGAVTHNLQGDWIDNNTSTNFTNTSCIINCNGTSDQTIGGTANTEFYDLTINKATGTASLGTSKSVSNTLTLTNGKFDLNGYMLTVTRSDASAVVRSNSAYLFSENTGNSSKLKWNLGSATGTYTFPFGIGTASDEYLPLIVNLTGGDIGNVTASSYAAGSDLTPLPTTPTAVGNIDGAGGNNAANMIQRYWQIDKDGPSGTATITFTYADAEVPTNGEGTDIQAQRWNGSGWDAGVGTHDDANNQVQMTGIESFSPWALVKSASPLPIVLLSFDALANEDCIELKWSTSSETNNDYFTIEKSIDGEIFEYVTTINGAGNSNELLNYSAFDKNPYSGISYYRLKQTDYDERYSYSKIAFVNFVKKGDFDFIVFPNPLGNNQAIKIKFTGMCNEAISIKIQDMLGKIYFTNSFQMENETHVISIASNSNLSKGVYMVICSINNQEYAKKILVK